MEEKEIKTTKEKISEAVQTAKEKAGAAWKWACQNREEIAKWIPVGVGLIGIWKTMRPTVTESERERKLHEWYDPHTGCRWRLRRQPTNYEWAEIERRQRCGEYAADILDDMGLSR